MTIEAELGTRTQADEEERRDIYLLERAIQRFIGVRGDIRRIRFLEGSHLVECYVPDDALWNAVKDNLLIREYERAGIRLKDASGIVIDAGAHVGLFALRASHYASTVIALEPHPFLCQLLRLNLAKNPSCPIEAIPKALWRRSGKVAIFEGKHSAASSVLGPGKKHIVPAVSLEELVGHTGSVDLLKLDIEGAEYEVLEAAPDSALRQINAITAELHLSGHDKRVEPLVHRLESNGFVVQILNPPVLSWRDSIRRVVQGWTSTQQLNRLKVAILAIYTGFALARNLDLRPPVDPLRYLYARRESSSV